MTETLTPQQAYDRALGLHMGGKLAEAEAIYQQIIAAVPSFGPPHMALGVLAGQRGSYLESAHRLTRASELLPESADVWSNLGNVLRILERYDEAIAACQKATQLAPNHAFAWGNLAGSLRIKGKIKESLAAAERALSITPGFLEGSVNKGCALQALGDQKGAIEVFRTITQQNPKSLYGWSCYLLSLQYSDHHSAEDVWVAAQQFGQTLSVPPRPRRPSSIKRIGFISGDFCRHPVGQFMEGLLKDWDHSRHQVTLFSNLTGGDEQTERLKELADGFVEINGKPDGECHNLIASQKIDLLVDLSGHTAKNRLNLLVGRPAPYMASYLGYSATTGLPQMDVMIGDSWCTPVEHEAWYCEKVMRLPGSLFASEWAPFVHRPAKSRRVGSFANPSKISEASLDMWCELLRQVPDLTLVLKYRGFDDGDVRASFAQEVSKRGVSPDRLEFHGWVSREDHFCLLAGLDLGLDTYPYSGATTTLDFIQQGVPVPTLIGDRYVSRMSASVLAEAGLESLICSTPVEWVEKCRRILDGEVVTPSDKERRILANDFQDLCDQIPGTITH